MIAKEGLILNIIKDKITVKLVQKVGLCNFSSLKITVKYGKFAISCMRLIFEKKNIFIMEKLFN